MGKPRTERSTEEIAEALKTSAGIISVAAKKLGLTYQAVWLRIEKEQVLKDAQEEGDQIREDLAEKTLVQAMTAAPWRDRITAAIRTLSRKKSKRGYNTTKIGFGGEEGGEGPLPSEFTVTFKA